VTAYLAEGVASEERLRLHCRQMTEVDQTLLGGTRGEKAADVLEVEFRRARDLRVGSVVNPVDAVRHARAGVRASSEVGG